MFDAVQRSTRALAIAVLLSAVPGTARADKIVEGGSLPLPRSSAMAGRMSTRSECVPHVRNSARSSTRAKASPRVGRILLRQTTDQKV